VNYYKSEVIDSDFTQGKEETRRDVCGNFSKAFHGYYDALVRGHIPFAVIDEVAIEKGELENYQALIMPNCACLSDETAKIVASFVERGGTLVATLGTSSCNQFGESRGQLALAEVLGVSWNGGFAGPYDNDHLFIQDKHDSFTWPGQGSAIPAPPWAISLEATKAEVSLTYRQKAQARYSEIPPPSSQPAICEHRYGEGRSIYFAGNFDELYHDYQLDEIRKILLWPLEDIKLPVVVEGLPQSVEVVPRMQGNRLIVHFINYTGEMTRPIREIVPINNIRLGFPGLSGLNKVRTLFLGKELDLKKEGDWFKVTLPFLNAYDVLVLEDVRFLEM
jgi:beta-galactosidase GanA